MKNYFVFMAICYSLWGAMSFGADRVVLTYLRNKPITPEQRTFNALMQSVASSIEVYDFLRQTGSLPAEFNQLINGFRTNLWPLFLSELDEKIMSTKTGWFKIVRELKKYDKKWKSRSDWWYLDCLLDFTSGLAQTDKNDAFIKGLWAAYRATLIAPMSTAISATISAD